ncbi:5-formyltetrahydrofolate cyclo-ligase [Halolamina sediminis]|jgi:5-formyltetrahydrofolate cyclo-ligase|uniref:5-formyltetrahydrofolate cyclo-ligase n=1 Tax=Halolamina sediminis TaxID=1480675 RepID=UPI0006B4828B|nr:5-formyltetrahydrofolate cyclo-ligase [Halolamina sediminis]
MEKQTLRERVWDELEASGDARFPFPPHGRIPNFAGAEEAADRLAATEAWAAAETIKSNPDSPQRPVRRRALEAGKVVYMAVPRLSDEDCFLRLDPAEIDDIDHATTIGGSSELGVQVGPEAMAPIDLIVSGSVAVTEDGARVGKGEGYSDLEFAILRAFGLVDDDTTTVTTVHEMQVVDEDVPTTALDVPMDRLLTPERSIRTDSAGGKPSGIDWDALDDERLEEIPILSRLEP